MADKKSEKKIKELDPFKYVQVIKTREGTHICKRCEQEVDPKNPHKNDDEECRTTRWIINDDRERQHNGKGSKRSRKNRWKYVPYHNLCGFPQPVRDPN